MKTLLRVVPILALVASAEARSVAPKTVDKGALPALKAVQAELPASGPLEAHRYHFKNPRGAVEIVVTADFVVELSAGDKSASGKGARVALDGPADVAITVAPGRGERGGKYTIEAQGHWACGGVGGLPCPAGARCAITAKYPDAMGTCVAEK